MLKELAISIGLPMAGMALVIVWKQLLKDELGTEDYLVILELLVASLTLTAAIWVDDNNARSQTARDVAAVITGTVGIVVFPMAAVLVKRAYDPKHRHSFTREDAWCANAIGVEVFFLSYFFTHLPS